MRRNISREGRGEEKKALRARMARLAPRVGKEGKKAGIGVALHRGAQYHHRYHHGAWYHQCVA